MIGATHFIELYKIGDDYELGKTFLTPIRVLQHSLAKTAACSRLKTIAVWKGKAKGAHSLTIEKRIKISH